MELDLARQRACPLVHDQKLGHAVKGPGEDDALLLTAGERCSHIPDQGPIPRRRRFNLLMDFRDLRNAVIEVYLPSGARGFVEIGQFVKLKYDAFPYQKFGIKEGVVETISKTAQLPQEIGVVVQNPEPLYRVGIALSAQSVEAFDEAMPLQAGMELTADIVLEDRRLLEWVLEPIQ